MYSANVYVLDRLRPTYEPHTAQSKVCAASLGFRCSKSILHTHNLSLFDNLEFDIFDAGGPKCYLNHVCYHCS